MFQSIKGIGSSGGRRYCRTSTYEITDDDFVGVASGYMSRAEAVISEYTKRNLDVARNLVRYLRWRDKEYGNNTLLMQAIMFYQETNPELKDALGKYLLLI
jgi:hypothetical protein